MIAQAEINWIGCLIPRTGNNAPIAPICALELRYFTVRKRPQVYRLRLKQRIFWAM